MTKTVPLRTTFAANIEALRKSRKMTQSSIAALAGKAGKPVNQRTVGRAIKGEQPPTLDTVESIALAFEVPAWQLLMPTFDATSPPLVISRPREMSESDLTTIRQARTVLERLSPEQRAAAQDLLSIHGRAEHVLHQATARPYHKKG